MELGGHAPVVVFESANIDKAVDQCIKVKFRFMGQVSSSRKRKGRGKRILYNQYSYLRNLGENQGRE